MRWIFYSIFGSAIIGIGRIIEAYLTRGSKDYWVAALYLGVLLFFSFATLIYINAIEGKPLTVNKLKRRTQYFVVGEQSILSDDVSGSSSLIPIKENSVRCEDYIVVKFTPPLRKGVKSFYVIPNFNFLARRVRGTLKIVMEFDDNHRDEMVIKIRPKT